MSSKNAKPSSDNDNQHNFPRSVCPICDKLTVQNYAPFCSKRCADIDLHHWLSGNYAVPGAGDDSEGLALADDDGA